MPQTLTLALSPIVAVAVAVALALCLLAYRIVKRLRQEHALRVDAERAATQSDRLATLAAALGQARTPRTAIETAVQEPLFALKADAGALLLVHRNNDTPELARAVGYPHQQKPPSPRLSTKNPVADAVGRGAPVVIESRDIWAAEYPDDPILARAIYHSTVVVPLLIGSRVVAVLHFEFHEPRVMNPDDHTYLTELGTRAAQALDRTWQLEYAERARSEAETLRGDADRELVERKGMEAALRTSETRYRALAARTSRLHALASALSGAVNVDAVARAVADHGRIAAGATIVEMQLTPEVPGATTVPDAGVPGATVPTNDACVEKVVRTCEPVFIRSFAEWQERFPQSAGFAADGAYESSATLPLLVEGAAIGTVAFHFTAPVNFDDDYQTLLMSVASHCAQALERARLYDSTQRARAEAEEANRSKDEFVSIVSHELRTPLSAMLGWASMLKKGALDSQKAERALQSICDNASRQSKLIEELLDFSRVTSGHAALNMETIEIRDVIRGVVESMIPTAGARGIQIELSPVPPVLVVGDMRRLEQVFFNLIDNALKFTPENGHVAITVRILDSHVELTITDDGAGIDPEFLPFVFDRFRQGDASTTRSHGGLGLGMSIAKQLVQAHDGDITVASGGRGQGSTFTVTLPRLREDAARQAAGLGVGPGTAVEPHRGDQLGSARPDLDGLRILVVDDEPDARDVMTHALEDYGARVTSVGSARDAMNILERENVDAMLADISMPGEDGYSLIRKVRASKIERVAAVPAAAVTALTRDEHRQKALAAGFQAHIAKPFGPAQLAAAVERLTTVDGSSQR